MFYIPHLQLWFILVTVLVILGLIGNSKSQFIVNYKGQLEFPSLKCIIKPTLIDYDANTRRVCFCLYVPYTAPAYHCVQSDGKATYEDIKLVAEMIRNTTNSIAPAKSSDIIKKRSRSENSKKTEESKESEEAETTPATTTTKRPSTKTTAKPKTTTKPKTTVKLKTTLSPLAGLSSRRASNSGGLASLFGF